jgi:hypothetical protein
MPDNHAQPGYDAHDAEPVEAQQQVKTSAVAGNGGSTMSFDALTISGVVAALISAGFIVGVVRNNERTRRQDAQDSSTE